MIDRESHSLLNASHSVLPNENYIYSIQDQTEMEHLIDRLKRLRTLYVGNPSLHEHIDDLYNIAVGHDFHLHMLKTHGSNQQEVSPEVAKAVEILGKAEGEGSGSFRGGDPEEMQRKREETRRENIETGKVEEQQAEAESQPQEEPDPAAIQEAQEKEEDKKFKSMDYQSDSTGPSNRMLALEVSPVDTFGDYNPKDANGDPVSLKPREQKYFPPGPPRQGPNQQRNWSEVIGIHIPLAGSPIQELRRFYGGGDAAGATRASQMMPKSMIESMISKAEEGSAPKTEGTTQMGGTPAAGAEGRARGGKYVKRWFVNGRWEYAYQDQPHENHGPGQLYKPEGHSLEVHQDFKGDNPKDAFSHSFHMAAAEGGNHPTKMWDDNKNEYVDKVVHFPGAKKDKEGKTVKDQKTGLPVLQQQKAALIRNPGQESGGSPVSNLSALHKKLMPVITIKDAHGDPWVHWVGSTTKGDEQIPLEKPKIKYDSASQFSHPEDVARGWHQGGHRSIENAIKDFESRKAVQEHLKKEQERGSVPPEERTVAKNWEPTFHEEYDIRSLSPKRDAQGKPIKSEMKLTNALERGDLGPWKWNDEERGHTVVLRRHGKPPEGGREAQDYDAVKYVKKPGRYIDFGSHEDRRKALEQLQHENYHVGVRAATALLHKIGRLKKYQGELTPDTKAAVSDLLHHSFGSTIENAANRFDPSKGARFSTYLQSMLHGSMLRHLPHSPEVTGAAEEPKIMQQRAAGMQRYLQERSLKRTGQPLSKWTEAEAPAPTKKEVDQPEYTAEPKRSLAPGRSTEPRPVKNVEKLAAPEPTEEAKTWEQKLQSEGLGTEPEHTMESEEPSYEEPSYDPFGTRKSLVVNAVNFLMKAADDAEISPESDQDQMKYLWREGEPGAQKYMWENPQGDVVRGTNAPEGHPHHDPNNGPPQIHPQEPTTETASHMFDKYGRKLHRPVPDGVESVHNENYDPDVNNWVEHYQDPESGSDEYIYLNKDRIKDHRLKFNEDLRYMDSQLDKFRQWYKQLFATNDPVHQMVGLIFILLDQANMIADGDESGILSIKLKDVKQSGNTFSFSYKDANKQSHLTTVVFDNLTGSIFKMLMQGKGPNDYLFQLGETKLKQEDLAKMFDEIFGLNLTQLRVYRGTEIFSKEFQNIAASHPNLKPQDLPKIANKAYVKVARAMGHVSLKPNLAQQLYVDPIAVEALYMSAIHHHHPDFNKSKNDGIDEKTSGEDMKVVGKMVVQGLPISIENPAGSIRKWHDKNTGERGETKLLYPYGFIRHTKGIDKGEVDVYVGPHRNSQRVFIVHQMKGPTFKEFDEDKIMLAFSTPEEAKEAYLKHYDDPGFFGSMGEMSMREFKQKVFSTKDHPHMIMNDKIPGGKAEGRPDTDFDAKQLEMGTKVEMEHTNDPALAHEIARDHLAEFGSYYSHLDKLEQKLKDTQKSFSKADSGPIVWNVFTSIPDRTDEEEAFSLWVHSHPMHEHDQQWAAFKQATNIPDVPIPDPKREYADGSNQLPEVNQEMEQEEPDYTPPEQPVAKSKKNSNKSYIKVLMEMAI